MWIELLAWGDVLPQPGCPGVPTKAYRCQLGPGLAAVLTAAGQLLVSIVALAAGILWGGAVALHPELRACLQHGPLLTMALQVLPLGLMPSLRLVLSRLQKVINFTYWTLRWAYFS